ncbi:hypothetical protein [Methylobacterium sp. NEAU K]|nr:hypothetical protein [Methylobacterium sp. NEAU K]MDP4004815.1 hypothetical protein [Methylobacterium sp. NEAU K]
MCGFTGVPQPVPDAFVETTREAQKVWRIVPELHGRAMRRRAHRGAG